MTYDPAKRLKPLRKTYGETSDIFDALAHDGEAFILAQDYHRIRNNAHRRGYKWQYEREGRYYRVTVKRV